MKFSFVHGLIVGVVVALMISGILLVSAQNNSWNNALSKVRSQVMETPQFAGLDNTYDLGYQRCQDKVLKDIVELKRE